MNDQFDDTSSEATHVFTRHLGRLLRDAHLKAHAKARETMPGGRHPRDWGVMAGLEAEGLVERGRNPEDRRSYALALTDAGRAAVARTAPEIVQTERQFLGALSGPERERLARLLHTLLLGGRSEPVPPVLAGRGGFLLAAGYRYSRGRLDAALE